ncbi:uncharacterized protein LOC127729772 [Mytilus californianus]|uniref:uncharacterized protein LOC127729772 n=1 Tax=Mytilus californianus TaxID=6549 RepID=UPI002246E6B1|nr:uncharacterized protein LOC127729772 [Mytilus californianus]
MGTDHCVECSRKVTTKQHALQCDSCSLWQHRVCNTGITMKEYRSMMQSEETVNFICTKCNDVEEETTSCPVNSTHITDVSDQPIPDYGTFNLSVISAANTTNSLNTTFTISREPDHTTEVESDPAGAPEQTIPEPDTEPNLTASFDVTRRPIEDQQEILEDSLIEPDLPDTILPDIPVTYTLVDQGSQRGWFKLVSSDGYEYTKKSSKGDFTYWRCSKRSKTVNCPATVSQKGTDYKMNTRQHIHQADKGALKKVVVRKEVKAESLRDIHKSARRIVDDKMLEHIEPEDHQLPKVKNLERLANRVRKDLRPDEPQDLNFVLDTDYLQCNDFIIGDIRVDNERHLMFASPNQLQILQQAKRWFCDGTFKILADPFAQLWSIHAFIHKGDSYKQIPLVFCLMSRRKGRDYVAVFQRLKEVLLRPTEVQGFVADFEQGAWKAIRKEFPTSTIKGCAFHFGQAVWRKKQELGLKTTYTSRGAEYRYI